MRKSIIAIIVTTSFAVIGCSDVSVESRIASAEQNIKVEKYNEAIIEYKNLLQEDPANSELRQLLAKALYKSGDLEGAEKEFRRSIDAGITSSEVLATYALTLYFQSKFSDVVDLSKEFASENTKELNVISYISLLRTNDPSPSEVRRKKNNLQGEYLRLAEVLANFFDANFSKANEQLQALSLPEYFAPLQTQIHALLLSRSGDSEEALSVISPLANRWKAVAVIALTELEVLIAAQKYDEAREVLKNWISERSSPMFDLLLADVSLRQSDFESGFANGEKAIQKGLNTYQSNLITGVSALNFGKLETAYRYLKRAHELNPLGKIGTRYLAKSQLGLGYSEEAADLLKKLDIKSQQDLEFMLQASEYLNAERKTESSINVIKSALDKSPNSLPLLVQLASMQFNVDTYGYSSTLRRLESLSDDSLAVAYLAIQKLISENRYAEALERAVALESDAPAESLVLQGTILFNQTQFSEALSKAEQALDKSSDSLPAIRLAMLASFEAENINKALKYSADQVVAGKAMPYIEELIFLIEQHPDLDVALYLDELANRAKEPEVKEIFRSGLAKYLIGQGDMDAAMAKLPGDVNDSAWLTLSEKMQFHVVRGNLDSVDALLRSLASAEDSNADDFVLGVAYYFSTNELTKAKKLIEQAEGLFPSDNRFALGHFELLLRTNKFEQADAKLNQLRNQGIDEWQITLLRGQKAMLGGEVSDAIVLMKASFKSNPLKSTAIVLAKAQSLAGQHMEGLATLEKGLLDKGNSREQDFHTTAEYAVAHGFLSEGANIYKRLLENWPNSTAAKNNLAALLVNLKKYDSAVIYAKEAVEANRTAPYLDTYGWALLNAGEVKRAQSLFIEALEMDDDYEEAAVHLAISYIQEKKREKALEIKNKYSKKGSMYEMAWERLF